MLKETGIQEDLLTEVKDQSDAQLDQLKMGVDARNEMANHEIVSVEKLEVMAEQRVRNEEKIAHLASQESTISKQLIETTCSLRNAVEQNK